MARRKYVPPPPPTMREMIRNMIRTSSWTHRSGDYTTTLDSIYFLMHGHNQEDVNNELSKWIDLKGMDLNTPIILPEKFFD